MKKILLTIAFCAFSTASQAATIFFDLIGRAGPGLLALNEPGVITGGSGGEIGAGISFDDVTKRLTINVGWGSANGFTDLTGSSTNAHVHGPTTNANGNNGVADWMQTAGVMINLQVGIAPGYTINTSASAGKIEGTGTTPLSLAQETALMSGRLYINVHTAANGGGEIRGFLTPVPEPSSALLGLAALGALSFRRRRA